ncbi:MAG TPA: histidine kinase dimerization/phosphoacceptor domain -containing protein [Caulobacteraceae bacterium]
MSAGAVLFGLAVAIRWRLGGLTEGFGPMLLLPAILLAGLFGGIRIGLGTAAICFLVAWVWFFPPYGTFVLEGRSAVTIATFILTASLELYVVRILNLAINDLSVTEERSATMFRELQHRVANNLQVVASVLRQERKKLDRDSAAARALETAQNRLDLMVRVHRSLNSPNIADLPIGSYFSSIVEALIRASNTPRVHLNITADPVTLDVERLMSLSMIVAETVTNALKYAFHGRPEGNLTIDFVLKGQVYILTVCDDGPGFSATSLQSNRDSLGRGIVESLASQLGGKISFGRGPGAAVKVVFPVRGTS